MCESLFLCSFTSCSSLAFPLHIGYFVCEPNLYSIFVLISVLCLNDNFPGRIPFAFLEEIHQRFVRTYGRAVFSAGPYGMNDEFSRVLSQQMEYYSSDPNADRINRLKGEMSQVTFNSFLIWFVMMS